MAITKIKIAKYTLLPEFIPRITALFRSGFHHISYMIATLFQMAGLLPGTHPYLNPTNIGLYGVRHVMAEAYKRLTFKIQYIDQVAIFFMVFVGLIILCVQFILLILMLITGDVMAAAPDSALSLIPWTDWFTIGKGSKLSAPAEQDMALMTLDRVFGVEGIFNSCISTGADCISHKNTPIPKGNYPTPIHNALHNMLGFYSYGIMVVGIIVLLYYIITITAETATTGTPFGERYSKAWAPVRLILFFALITPLNIGTNQNIGLNSAQIITLYTAKFGSNMASNGWGFFSTTVSNDFIKNKETLITEPSIPEIGNLDQFIFVAKTCAIGKLVQNEIKIHPYIIIPTTVVINDGILDIASDEGILISDISFSQALEKTKNGTVIIRFGEYSKEKHKTKTSFVSNECGEIKLQITDVNEPGSILVQESYFTLIQRIWNDPAINQGANCLIQRNFTKSKQNCPEWPSQNTIDHINQNYREVLGKTIKEGIATQIKNGDYGLEQTLKEKGWALAAVWFNKIAQMNGAVTTAIFNVPRAHSWPRVLEHALKEKRKSDKNIDPLTRFSSFLSNGEQIEYQNIGDRELAIVLEKAFIDWETGISLDSKIKPTGNIFIDTINMIMGTSGLFEMRRKQNENEIKTHPLAQIATLGKGMVEATMRNIITTGALKAGRSIFPQLSEFTNALGQAASHFLYSITMSTIVLGAILFYIVPFLPFIYFLFAVSGWIKSIFEAIVAMPIWALSHLRIDGEGIPGTGASNGYFLLLDIAIRPILIIVGLIASISIFAAMVETLNAIFDLIISNISEYEKKDGLNKIDSVSQFLRSPVDQLMFTVIYAVLVYMMAISSFKLIDQIPNQILRWAGSSVKTFQEEAGDPAGNLTQKIWRGGTIMTSPMQGGQLAAILS